MDNKGSAKMNKQVNKAQKAHSAAKSDVWESAFLVGGKRMKAAAKKAGKRAVRRQAKAYIRECV